MKRILTATDGSPAADRAVDLAANIARACKADLLIMTVPERLPAEVVEAFEAIEHVPSGDAADVTTRSTLARAEEHAKRIGATNVTTASVAGDPAQAILLTAGKRGADIIVVGRRGRGRLAGLLLGSVSQKLVSLAPCAVVVVP